MLSYGRRKLKNTAISYVDSYVPLGLTLGDLSSSLRVEEVEDVDEVVEDARETPDNDLYDKITARVLTQRRSRAASPASPASSSSGSTASAASEDTTIEFVFPGKPPPNDDPTPVVDIDALSRGLALLSMALNNDLVASNPQNVRRFTGQAVALVVNSVLDPDSLRTVFASLSDDTRLQVLRFYLSDDQLVARLKSEQGLDSLPASPPSSSSSSSSSFGSSHAFHRRSRAKDVSLEQLIVRLVQAFYAFSLVLYARFGVPLLNLLWSFLLTLNSHYRLLDIARALAVRTAALLLNLMLRLVVGCTTIVEETTVVTSTDVAASPTAADSAGSYARDAFFTIVQQGIVRASQKRHTPTAPMAPTAPSSAPAGYPE